MIHALYANDVCTFDVCTHAECTVFIVSDLLISKGNGKVGGVGPAFMSVFTSLKQGFLSEGCVEPYITLLIAHFFVVMIQWVGQCKCLAPEYKIVNLRNIDSLSAW